MPYVTSWERIAKKEGREEGREEGRTEGRTEGRMEGKHETAKELIKRGVDINLIAEATGIPVEELEKLADTEH